MATALQENIDIKCHICIEIFEKINLINRAKIQNFVSTRELKQHIEKHHSQGTYIIFRYLTSIKRILFPQFPILEL